MINLILGQPGGGKSYEAVAFHVIPALVDGRRVITNLPLNVEVIEAYFPGAARLIQLRTPQLVDGVLVRPFSRVEHYGDEWRHPETGVGPLYVIDECHLAMPRAVVDRAEVPQQRLVEEWYSMHRHELADVLLITQSYGKVNRAVIDLVQVVYRCKKATAFGTSNRYIRKVQDGVRGEVVNTAVREYEAKFFKFYRSHTKSSKAAEELTAGDIVPLWKRWPFKGAAICLLLFAAQVTYIMLRGDDEPPSPTLDPIYAAPAVTAPEAPPVQQQPQQAPPAPRGPAKQVHPYDGYGFHLTALMHRQRDDGQRHLTGYVTITQNGQSIRQVSFRDLEQAGYAVEYQSDTVIGLTYRGIDLGYVVSGLPTIKLAGNLPGKETDG